MGKQNGRVLGRLSAFKRPPPRVPGARCEARANKARLMGLIWAAIVAGDAGFPAACMRSETSVLSIRQLWKWYWENGNQVIQYSHIGNGQGNDFEDGV